MRAVTGAVLAVLMVMGSAAAQKASRQAPAARPVSTQSGAAAAATTVEDCDCSVKIRDCAGDIQVLESTWKYNDADNVNELHWTAKLTSSEPNACSCMQVGLKGHAGANADLDFGSHGIYKRKVIGSLTIKDYQRVPLQSAVEASGYHNICYVGGSKQAMAAEAAARAEAASAKAAADAQKVAQLQKQLQDRARALAATTSENLERISAAASSRMSPGSVTSRSSYQAVLDEQQSQAVSDGNAQLLGAVTSAATLLVGSRGSMSQGNTSEQCRVTLAQIADYQRSINANAGSTSATTQEVNRLSSEALAGNQQWYDQNCP